MAMIKLTPFGGMTPRTGKRLLPNDGAVTAENLKLASGEIRYLRGPGFQYLPATPKAASPLTIFKARTGASSSSWFSWPIDVDCVRVPLATDVESRFCWTGDGAPKTVKYTNAISGGASNYPLLANELTLGIPTPTVACGVSASGGTGSAVTRYYCYTYLSADGEESAPSPISTVVTGKVDDTWSITAMGIAPLNTGTVSGTTRSSNTITATTSLAHWMRAGDSVVVAAVGTMTEANGTWTVATVPTSVTFTYTVTAAATGSPGGAGTWTRSTPWNTGTMTKNLYRTSGSTGAFQLVNTAVIPVATTTYSDTYTDAVIAGDDLISDGWVPPPVGLRGLCVHPSGALVGFINNLLCFSEPLQPHAWPEAYQLSSGYNGVGVATFGSSVVMATAGTPFVAAGVEPASMSGEDYKGMYPCLAKRSVLGVGDGVLYSSLHGMVMVGSQGVGIFTDPWYTRDEWEALNPETMVAETANGRVYVTYTTDLSATSTLIFDGPRLTTATPQITTLYADESSGELYVGTTEGIALWDSAAEVVLQGSWRSKEWIFPVPINLGAGKVEFDLAIDPTVAANLVIEIAAIAAANAAYITPLTAQVVTISIASPAVIHAVAHGFVRGTEVRFTTTVAMLPTGLSVATSYYIIAAGLGADDFRVSATKGVSGTVTISAAVEGVVSWAGHHLVAGDEVSFSTTGALPTNIVGGVYPTPRVNDVTYYVLASGLSDGVSFKISTVAGGTAIDTTAGAQSGTHTAFGRDGYVVNTSGTQNGVHSVANYNASPGGSYNDEIYAGMFIDGSNIAIAPDAPPSNLVSVTLYSGDTVVASRQITDEKVFRFPAGYKRDHFSVQVTSQCNVKEIRLSETADGLRVA